MRRTFSLRSYLLLLVLGTMLPALIVTAVLVRRVVADNRQAVETRLLEAAHGEATLVDAELSGTIRALQGLEQSDRLPSGDVAGFYTQAQRLLESQPIWSAVTLTAVDGRELFNTARPLGESLPTISDRPSFDAAVSTKKPVIGHLHQGKLTGEWGFSVRTPIVRDGQTIFVVSAWITSRRFDDLLRRQALVSDEWVRGIVDDAGVVVARSRDADRFVGQKGPPGFMQRYAANDAGVYRDFALDGTDVQGAFARAPDSRWIAGVAVPASVVEAPFRESMTTLGGVSLLLLGLGFLGSYVISRQIARGISDSAAEAEAIVRGQPVLSAKSTITEIERLLEALASSAALLDQRQHERDEQVARADAARAEAEAADRAKDEFLAMLGHELRNPLAPALTALHLMKLRAPDTSVKERAVLERQIRHMARLVDDLLDVSRLRRGAIELRRERFDLADAVANAVEMTSPLIDERRHTLTVDVPGGLTVDGDRIRISQVLSNLLSNAAKYTEAGGHITVRARSDAGRIRIECSDDGMGMPAELVPHVFDLFVQGQRALDRGQGGLGLGLAVARSLVRLHGGVIEATSAGANQGSTFTVWLPLATAAAIAAEPTRSEPIRHAHVGRVLVVDDNQDALEMLLDALKTAGVDAHGALTASDALAMAPALHPDIAILDIGLPGMNGFDLARAMRSVNSGPRLLIALTGYGRDHDVDTARAAGFDAFFVKPVEVSTFLAALERMSQKTATP